MFSSINLLTLPISYLAGFMSLQGSFQEKFGLWSFSRTKAKGLEFLHTVLQFEFIGYIASMRVYGIGSAGGNLRYSAEMFLVINL